MKRNKLVLIALTCALLASAFVLVACNNAGATEQESEPSATSTETASGQISVYSREDGSGTRGAFIELFGIEEKDASGEKVDRTTTSAVITNSTSVMMTSVAGDQNGIGYLSLGSLNDTVKALAIDGVEASAENVKDGSYKISRPFNIATKDGLSPVAEDFINYILSKEGQAIIEENGYIAAVENATAYQSSTQSGKIVVAGSSSVSPVMEKLQEAYQALNPEVTIEVQTSDSTTGMNMAMEGTCDIGMASRELKDSETEGGLSATVIAQDGIAVIVNKQLNLDELTSEQVMNIFLGEVTSWEEVLAA